MSEDIFAQVYEMKGNSQQHLSMGKHALKKGLGSL